MSLGPNEKKIFHNALTLPIIHALFRVAISTNDEGVQVSNTNKSATDKFNKNKLVELLNTLEVRMTIMTRRFPKETWVLDC